ncbi:MAG: cobaltochelatase subunit CobN, partial [Planktotalea arctica]
MSEFETMGLPERLVSRLKELGLTTPTPIQARAIPEALNGHDVLGLAQTGTGKTAAFGLPLITLLSENPGRPAPKSVRALILAPTHAFATFYLWLRNTFSADVVLHFGMHGALEFMPGKQAGLGAR